MDNLKVDNLKALGKEEAMNGKEIHKMEEKLCSIGGLDKDKPALESFKALVKEPKFICKGCGRAAVNESNLCSPEKL